MDAARELAQLVERLGELVAGGVDEQLGRRRVLADVPLEEAQLHGEGDEALLGAVVEVALEALALGVAGRDEALARRPQLLEPRLRLGVQVLVLERDAGGGDTASTSSGSSSSEAS